MTDGVTPREQRLLQLARFAARHHHCRWKAGTKRFMEEKHSGDFAVCSHPDCVLVRESASLLSSRRAEPEGFMASLMCEAHKSYVIAPFDCPGCSHEALSALSAAPPARPPSELSGIIPVRAEDIKNVVTHSSHWPGYVSDEGDETEDDFPPAPEPNEALRTAMAKHGPVLSETPASSREPELYSVNELMRWMLDRGIHPDDKRFSIPELLIDPQEKKP